MTREKSKFKRGFYLRLKNKKNYFKEAGYSDYGEGPTPLYCQMTSYLDQAMWFKTAKSAEAMRRLLHDKYHKDTVVIKV